MTIEKKITLTKKDLDVLRSAAYILAHLSDSGNSKYWSANDMIDICKGKYEFENEYVVKYE